MVLAGGIAIAGLTMVLSTIAIYPQLPIELGGGKPRCVNLELDRTKIGPALEKQLLLIGAMSAADGGRPTFEEARTRRARREQLWTAAESARMVETGAIFLWSSTDK